MHMFVYLTLSQDLANVVVTKHDSKLQPNWIWCFNVFLGDVRVVKKPSIKTYYEQLITCEQTKF